MTIDEIKQYAEQEIIAFDTMTFQEQLEYSPSVLALEHLRMRQLWLVADIAESLNDIVIDLAAIRNRKHV